MKHIVTNCTAEHTSLRSASVGSRWLWIGLFATIAWAIWRLPLFVPLQVDFTQIIRFFSAALTPALSYEGEFVPSGIESFGSRLLWAGLATIAFAAAGVGLAILMSIPLALASSTVYWGLGTERSMLRSPLVLTVFTLARGVSTVLRSVHELMWAVLFLAAFGLSEITAVLAIALPYSGVFSRVFADILDESDTAPAVLLRNAGARRFSAFLFGILPLALPNIAAYILYRFECGIRSSAVLGFFGIPTLGYYISASFENLHYAEVWSYLYCLIAIMVLLDAFSHQLRKELIA